MTKTWNHTHLFLEQAGEQMISDLLDMIPKDRQASVVEAMELLANLLSPENDAFQHLLKGCRCGVLTDEITHEIPAASH